MSDNNMFNKMVLYIEVSALVLACVRHEHAHVLGLTKYQEEAEILSDEFDPPQFCTMAITQ